MGRVVGFNVSVATAKVIKNHEVEGETDLPPSLRGGEDGKQLASVNPEALRCTKANLIVCDYHTLARLPYK